MPVAAAGGVVHRNGEYLLAYRERYGDWTLPKGKLDPDEAFPVAAEREVVEETGQEAELGQPVGTVAYPVASGMKLVRYWLMRRTGGSFRPNREVQEIAWLGATAAGERLTYPRDVAVLRRADRMLHRPGTGRIYLVHHGRVEPGATPGGGSLDETGRRQAAGLAEVLADVPITRVVRGPGPACGGTIEPYRAMVDLPVEEEPALGSDQKDPEGVLRLCETLAGESAVVVAGLDPIRLMLDALRAEGRVDGPGNPEAGSMWVLDTVRGRARRARYVPPPS